MEYCVVNVHLLCEVKLEANVTVSDVNNTEALRALDDSLTIVQVIDIKSEALRDHYWLKSFTFVIVSNFLLNELIVIVKFVGVDPCEQKV